MTHPLAVSIVVGAAVVGAALVYHGRELRTLSVRLTAMEERTGQVGTRMDRLSEDLPRLIEEGARGAGREVVQGAMEAVLVDPWRGAGKVAGSAASNLLARARAGEPMVRFDIPSPVINVEIAADIGQLPWFRRPGETSAPPAGTSPPPAGAAVAPP